MFCCNKVWANPGTQCKIFQDNHETGSLTKVTIGTLSSYTIFLYNHVYNLYKKNYFCLPVLVFSSYPFIDCVCIFTDKSRLWTPRILSFLFLRIPKIFCFFFFCYKRILYKCVQMTVLILLRLMLSSQVVAMA